MSIHFTLLNSQLLIILGWGFVVYTLSLLSSPCTIVNRPVSGHPCAQRKCQTADTRTNSATRLTRTCSQNHATSALPYPADLQQCVSSSVASAASTAGILSAVLYWEHSPLIDLWCEQNTFLRTSVLLTNFTPEVLLYCLVINNWRYSGDLTHPTLETIEKRPRFGFESLRDPPPPHRLTLKNRIYIVKEYF